MNSLNKALKLNVEVSNFFNVFPSKVSTAFSETAGMYEAIQMGFGGALGFAPLKLAF